jgi:hypothetical protein
MRQISTFFLVGLALLGAAKTVSGDGAPPASDLHPYLFQENMIIEAPSDYWLIAVSPSQPVTKALWCNTAEPAEEILQIDGLSAHDLTREEIAAYFSGAHGWPVHLLAKPHSGGARAVDCFAHP